MKFSTFRKFQKFHKIFKISKPFFNFKFSVKLTTYLKSELTDLFIYLT